MEFQVNTFVTVGSNSEARMQTEAARVHAAMQCHSSSGLVSRAAVPQGCARGGSVCQKGPGSPPHKAAGQTPAIAAHSDKPNRFGELTTDTRRAACVRCR